MAFVPTGLLASIGAGLGGVLKALPSLVPAGLQIAQAAGAFNQGGGRQVATYMPGGAVATQGFPYAGGGIMSAGLLGGLLPAWSGLPGGGGEIAPQGGFLGFGRQRLPRIVMVQNPNNAAIYETYVKAPRVKYRVSIARAGGRRCVGGR